MRSRTSASPARLPGEIAAALTQPALRNLPHGVETAQADFTVNGERILATFRPLEKSQDWVVGIVVPERAYLGELLKARNRLLWHALLVSVCILVGGMATLRIVRGDLARVFEQSRRMQAFDFTPRDPAARLDDVQRILSGLEHAKTALRALSKYVPVALVRQLYELNAEPALSSELREVTLFFSDIEQFTAVAEHLPPNDLAQELGLYFETIARPILETGGILDKFIGDGIMAFWNVPLPVAHHSQQACAAALRCVRAAEELYASPRWQGRPAWHTRFGLHTGRVLVGNFGALDRLNYTAIGDGVILASRLEGLKKKYGTQILVSENVYAEAKDAYSFRLLDQVAVKGRSAPLYVHELLGTAGERSERTLAAAQYERAFALYQQARFVDALAILRKDTTARPSRVLAARCEILASGTIDLAGWKGVFVATEK